LTVRTARIDQLDVLVDSQFQASRAITAHVTRIELPAEWSTVEIRGSAGGELVQRRTVRR
jgi:hypothetical protein